MNVSSSVAVMNHSAQQVSNFALKSLFWRHGVFAKLVSEAESWVRAHG